MHPRFLARSTALVLVLLLSACATQSESNETPYIKPDLAQVDLSQADLSQVDLSQVDLSQVDLSQVNGGAGELKRRILLLGDAGHSSIDPLQASLQIAATRASIAPEKTSVVMLGDNIYYFGFPNKDEDQEQFDSGQLESISYLEAQLQIAKLSGAEMFLVPGNHDWYAEQVDSQAQYIEEYGRDNAIKTHFAPHQLGADPLPEIIHRDGVSIVFLDSMWLINQANEHQFQQAMRHMDGLLAEGSKQHPDNIILVTAHHPIETMGPHNKYYTSAIYKTLISTLELFGENDQDLGHPRYQRMVDGIELTLGRYPKAVFAGGHDHSLQVFKDDSRRGPRYRLVSGAANTSKISGVGTNEHSEFALSREGLMEMDVFENGVVLRVYAIDSDEPVHQQWLWSPE